MKVLAAMITALAGACALAACESASGSDGVSRFASTPYYGPGSVPREAQPATEAPEIPGQTDQDTLGGKLDGDPGKSATTAGDLG